jgi:hypothetical protein
MNKQVELLGILFWVRGGLALSVGLLFALVGVLGSLGLLEPNEPLEERISGGVGALVLVTVFIAQGVGYLLTGTALRRLRPWARTAGLVLGILELVCCCSFPLGTALAIYTLVVLFNDEVARLFAERPV